MNSQVDAALKQLSQTLGNFCKFLEEEAVALASQNAERLSSMLPERNAIHRDLATHWLALGKVAGADNPQGIADIRTRLFGSAAPNKEWSQLEELVHASDRLNRVNGRLMEEQMRRTEVALQVLRQSMHNRGVYDAGGKVTDFINTNRRIDSA